MLDRKQASFTNPRGMFDLKESCGMRLHLIGVCLAIGLTVPAAAADPVMLLAQAMVPPTGMGDADKAMAAEERMRRRFPQPVRVGDLIGQPVLDDEALTLGYVRKVVRTPQDKIQLIVAYNGWCGWCDLDTRQVAVPIEAVGIIGSAVASLDMSRSEFAKAPTWQGSDATVLPNDDSIRIALARR
jgi:hypothetical protein